ncbi:hypothetical protein ACQPVA_01475 [Clostridium butyricum]|uniref:hypothetical protein n=1 Tax=Clostridium butyricum TaxID=1492 RepID=UPI003D33A3DA
MKKDITVTITEEISEELLEKYYKQLWNALKDQFGNEDLKEFYIELCKDEQKNLMTKKQVDD